MIDQLVVDSSVAVKWVANEPYSAEARRILSDYQAGQITLLHPISFMLRSAISSGRSTRFRVFPKLTLSRCSMPAAPCRLQGYP